MLMCAGWAALLRSGRKNPQKFETTTASQRHARIIPHARQTCVTPFQQKLARKGWRSGSLTLAESIDGGFRIYWPKAGNGKFRRKDIKNIMRIYLVNPSDVAFGVGVITPR